MRKDILKIASKKFQELSKKYKKFLNVFVDDWRGYRFIFDTKDVRKCNNDCVNCDLFKLLKGEKENLFSAGLYLASDEDKKIFGPQNYLNCKTLKQYADCYTNFLINSAKNKSDILAELKLIKQLRIIYSKNNDRSLLEKEFKDNIIRRVLKKQLLRKSG